MGAAFLGAFCRGYHQLDFTVCDGREDNHALSEFFFQAVTEFSQRSGVHAFHLPGDEPDSANFLYVLSGISHRVFRRLALQGIDLRVGFLQFRLQRSNLFKDFSPGCFQHRSCGAQFFFLLAVVVYDIPAGQGFDPSDTGRYAGLGQDLEVLDLRGVFNMRSAAQLLREPSHLNNTDFLSVLLVKQSHRSALLRLIERHDLGHHRKGLLDLFVDDILHFPDLFRRHGLEVGEIESESVRIHVGTLLFHMSAENLFQRLLAQVGCGVISRRRLPERLIYCQSDLIAHLQHSPDNGSDMADLSAEQMDGILHLEFAFRSDDHSMIPDLAAHGPVERGQIDDDRSFLSVCKGLRDLRLPGDRTDL